MSIKFDIRSLTGSFLVRLFSATSSVYVAFFLSINLGMEAFGSFTFVVSVATFISIISRFGLDTFYIKNREILDRKEFLSKYMLFSSVNSALLSVLLFFLIERIYPIPINSDHYFWIAVFSLLYVHLGILSVILKTRGDYSMSAVHEPIFLNGLLLPVILVADFFGKLDGYFLFYALLFLILILLFAGYLIVASAHKKSHPARIFYSGASHVELLRSGLPFFKAAFTSGVQNFIVVLFLGGVSMSDVGLYRLIERAGLIVSFFLGVVNIASPVRFRALLSSRVELINEVKAFSFVSGSFGVVSFAAILLFNYLTQFPFGSESLMLFVLYGFAQVVNTLSGPLGNLLLIAGDEKFVYQINLYAAIFLVFLTPFVLSNFAISGVIFLLSFFMIALNIAFFFRVRYLFNFWAIPNFKAACNVLFGKGAWCQK